MTDLTKLRADLRMQVTVGATTHTALSGAQLRALLDALDAAERERDLYRDRCRTESVCMTCVLGAPDTFGCTDCLNTGYDRGQSKIAEDLDDARTCLIAIRRRAIFGPGLTISDLLDLTADVAGLPDHKPTCVHAPTYDAGLCCGHPDDCTFIAPERKVDE